MKDKIILGKLGAAYGVRGWLKVISYTQPIDNILNYPNWYLRHNDQWQTVNIENSKPHGNGIIVKIKGITDREHAQSYTNDEIAVDADTLPTLIADEHYWKDLIGMAVVNTEGVALGTVNDLLETGSNDVLIVKGDREHLIPYTKHVIQSIDTKNKTITVDWDPDF